jgi:transcriptional regulator with XRE-family HTH domain
MIGDKIKDLRIELGITQKELGEKIGVNPNTITNYEKGYREPDINTLNKLADIFECTVDYLMDRVNNKDEYIAVVKSAKDANIPADKLKSFIDFLKNSKGN